MENKVKTISVKKSKEVITNTIIFNDVVEMKLIITKENDKIIDTEFYAKHLKNKDYVYSPVLVDSELFSKFKQEGWPRLKLEYLFKTPEETFWKIVENKDLTLFPVFLCHYDHSMYLPLEDKHYRTFYFGYIEGNIDNENYHLRPLIEYLKKKEDVYKISDIQRIPSYNAGNGRDFFVSFNYFTEIPFKKESCFDLRERMLSKLGLDQFKLPKKKGN